MEQNIVSLGFDIAAFSAQKQQIILSLNEVYEKSKTISDSLIKPGSTGGWTELTTKVKAQEQAISNLQSANLKYANTLQQVATGNKQAAQATAALSTATKEDTKSLEDNIQTRRRLQNANASYLKDQKEDLALLRSRIITQAEYAKRLNESTAKIEFNKNKISELSKEIKNQTLTASQQAGAYALLNKEYQIAQTNAKNLAAIYGVESAEAKQAAASAAILDAELKAIDKTVGQSQRNVGNYGSAFDNVTKGASKALSVLRNIAYIVPGLGLAGVIGLIIDPIIAGTKYLLGFGEASEKVKRQQEEIANSFKIAADSVGDEISKVTVLKTVLESDNATRLQKVEALRQLKAINIDYFGQLDIENGKVTGLTNSYDAYVQSLIRSITAKANIEQLSAAIKEQQNIVGKLNANNPGSDGPFTAENLSQYKIFEAIGKFNLTFAAKKGESVAITKEQRQLIADLLNSEFKVKEITERIKASVQDAFTPKKETVGKAGPSEKQLEELKAKIDNVFEIYKLQQQRIINLDKEGADDEKATFDKRIEDLGSFLANSRVLIDAEEQHDIELKQRAVERENKHLEETKKGKSGDQAARIDENIKINQKNLEQEINLIHAQAVEKKFQVDHDYYTRFSELQKAAALQEVDDNKIKENKIYKLRDEVSAKVAENERKILAKQQEEEEKAKEALNAQIKKDAELSYDLGVALINAKYERELNAIQKLIDANNKLKETETERINSSTLSAQEKAAQLIILDRTVAANNEKLLREQRAIKLKEAKFDRDAAVLKILSETAVAAAKAGWVTPLAIAVEAAGLLQAGLILAKPLPTYADGTENHPGGGAIVGEGKGPNGWIPELIQPKGGKSFITDRPMLINNLPKGSKVTPLTTDDINSAMYNGMMLHTANMLSEKEDKKLSDIKDAIEKGSYMTAQALRKQRGASVTVNVHGSWGAYIDKNCRE